MSDMTPKVTPCHVHWPSTSSPHILAMVQQLWLFLPVGSRSSFSAPAPSYWVMNAMWGEAAAAPTLSLPSLPTVTQQHTDCPSLTWSVKSGAGQASLWCVSIPCSSLAICKIKIVKVPTGRNIHHILSF